MSVRDLLRLAPGTSGLAGIDPRSTPGAPGDKDATNAAREACEDELVDLQERLWAEAVHGSPRRVVLLLQGMDTSGKDGSIKKGLRGLNPKWMHAVAFGAPTEEERRHHFLWRVRREIPAAGKLGVFDRSHYEDVLVVRVRGLAPPDVWEPRFDEINAWEKGLVADGVTLVKVFLHISPEEQHDRQLRRLDRDDKRWKFDAGDLDDRDRWDDFMQAYADVLERCGTEWAPWHVVPADRKWYRNWAVSQLVLETYRELDPQWPQRPDLDVEACRARLSASA